MLNSQRQQTLSRVRSRENLSSSLYIQRVVRARSLLLCVLLCCVCSFIRFDEGERKRVDFVTRIFRRKKFDTFGKQFFQTRNRTFFFAREKKRNMDDGKKKKKKQLSGAQKRKKKKEKEAALMNSYVLLRNFRKQSLCTESHQ
jgi:hypothetical protein|tara:strand:- start:778 stop:1206 length:429 start_codon:yes stop_codon:yes gene_type:complete